MGQKRRDRFNAETKTKGQTDDQHIAAGQRFLGDNADPRRHNAAKHHHRRAAQHRRRDLAQYLAERRKQTQQNQNHPDVAANVAAGDAGHLNHAVVLRKGRIGERAQHRRHHAADAISQNAAFQP